MRTEVKMLKHLSIQAIIVVPDPTPDMVLCQISTVHCFEIRHVVNPKCIYYQISELLHFVHLNIFTQGRGALQDIDQMVLFKPLCKFCATIRKVRDIVPTIRNAIAIAQSGVPGESLID